MKTLRNTVAKPLPPEDIRPGEYIVVMSIVDEFPSFFWCDSSTLSPYEPVRICGLPEQGGKPLKVQAVCLPFVLAKGPDGLACTLDVRENRLARVSGGYAKKAWKALKKQRKKYAKQ